MDWTSRRRSAAVALAGLALLTVGGAVGGVLYALENPWVLCRATEWALEWPEGSIRVEDLILDRSGRFELVDLRLDPPVQRIPVLDIASLSGRLPPVTRILRERVIHLGAVEGKGVRVFQRVQRPPEERPPPPARPLRLSADSVRITDAHYSAAADPPFSEVEVTEVSGELTAVRWVPALRSFEGVGRAGAGRMTLGKLELTELVVPHLALADGDLELGPSTFAYGRTPGFAHGAIRGLEGRPEVEIEVRLEGSRVEIAVEDAMDRASPVMGWLTTELTIRAGGDLERGDARFEGWIALSEAYVFVGQELKLIPKLLLDVAPWFQREDGGWLAVGDLYGEAKFGRGWVELERLERVSKRHRILQAWGTLADGRVDLTVRAVPKKAERTGLGVRVRGPLNQASIKLAHKEELMEHPEVLVVD